MTIVVAAFFSTPAYTEDGYDLWLRYRPVEAPAVRDYARQVAEIIVPTDGSATIKAARDELSVGLSGLLARTTPVRGRIEHNGAVVLGTPSSSSIVAGLKLDLSGLGSEGYVIRATESQGRHIMVIAANSDVGVLHGAFAFLRLIQTRQPLERLELASAPRIQLRVLNHWDNLNGTVERGFAGKSIFDWSRPTTEVDPRLTLYARANASIGINGVVLNNVNSDAKILTEPYLKKVAAIAAVLRPYGIKVYLCARFSAPLEIGDKRTADPLEPAVRAWWRLKADEIYRDIPDFGGFLVKADSEGQPGPQSYHGPIPVGAPKVDSARDPSNYQRTHADGANMLAEALAPHAGIVIWRAFVYSVKLTERVIDRSMQAYEAFIPVDGQFLPNVIVQVKNGPIDFQPREPIHPLFGAMSRSSIGLEFQITKEYLGRATHLVFLAPMWKETLDTDTYARGEGSTVGRIVDGSIFHQPLTSIAGVANVGSDRNWCGSHFDQSNWYAFGRLAWDHELSETKIAQEWVRMTWTNSSRAVDLLVPMMMGSHAALVDYMTPLGLAFQISLSHYAPSPWDHGAVGCNSLTCYDAGGIGVDRSRTGSNAVGQYAPRLAAEYNDVDSTPSQLLLWFHHLPWDYRLSDGRTVWEEILARYARGVTYVHNMRVTWAQVANDVDRERYDQVSEYLGIQEREARWWRDVDTAFYQSIADRPLPPGVPAPPYSLEYYRSHLGGPPAEPLAALH